MTQRRDVESLPRIPLAGSIDLTYRCNNSCMHCWLRETASDAARGQELTAGEIKGIVDQARAMGTQDWSISGGEPMLRADFAEVFEYIAGRSRHYSLNTNGTLITPEIAGLLRRPGNKMVAVYGSSAEVYDRVTRNPGGFDALVQGLSYLKEAGAGFTVQLIPMRENWDQWDEMIHFAREWSDTYRVGASWLHMTACQSDARNAEIERQRLDPGVAAGLDSLAGDGGDPYVGASPLGDDRVLAGCVASSRQFHIDPYGGLSFCAFAKDPALRYDLRHGSLEEAWEEFIPSLADAVRGGREYLEGCGKCELRSDCRWCDVYGFLEHGRHGAKVDYLCRLAEVAHEQRVSWTRDHRRYFEIAGITVQVDSDLVFDDHTFESKFDTFRAAGPGSDVVVLRHHFEVPTTPVAHDASETYRRLPWAVYRQGNSWIYEGLAETSGGTTRQSLAVFNRDHTRGEIYNQPDWAGVWRDGGLGSLTLFPTDQILLARLLADRGGCILHSGAVTIDGQGLLFVGHSDTGKSTTMELIRGSLGERATILCDDRNVVRRGDDGFRVHGTWSHGDVPDVSSSSGPLRAILFLEQSPANELELIEATGEVTRRLLATLIRPMVTADWWLKELDVIEAIASEVPCYIMRFDRGGAIVPMLERLTR